MTNIYRGTGPFGKDTEVLNYDSDNNMLPSTTYDFQHKLCPVSSSCSSINFLINIGHGKIRDMFLTKENNLTVTKPWLAYYFYHRQLACHLSMYSFPMLLCLSFLWFMSRMCKNLLFLNSKFELVVG